MGVMQTGSHSLFSRELYNSQAEMGPSHKACHNGGDAFNWGMVGEVRPRSADQEVDLFSFFFSTGTVFFNMNSAFFIPAERGHDFNNTIKNSRGPKIPFKQFSF